MQLEFPYQIVTFLDDEPAVNEPVYYGERGWYPQLALKRRFNLSGAGEKELISVLSDFFNTTNKINITTGSLVKPNHMPVHVIDILNQEALSSLHGQLLQNLGNRITSRYPDREGNNYYPHITAEYNGNFVIPVDDYTNKTFTMNNVWLLKDVDDENSIAFSRIR